MFLGRKEQDHLLLLDAPADNTCFQKQVFEGSVRLHIIKCPANGGDGYIKLHALIN